jgi:hypothetical protein
MGPATGIARVNMGSTREPKPWSPSGGNQCRSNEKTCIAISPIRKTGTETVADGSASTKFTSHKWREFAAKKATAKEIARARASDAAARTSVGGKTSPMAFQTGAPLCTDVPKLPCRAAQSRSPYWTTAG